MKIFQIHRRIRLEYRRNLRRLPTYSFIHAKAKKVDFRSENSRGDIGIIPNDSHSGFYSIIINISAKLIWRKCPKILGIQPKHK